MIPAWWLVPAFVLGSWVGLLVAALCAASKQADEMAALCAALKQGSAEQGRPEVTD